MFFKYLEKLKGKKMVVISPDIGGMKMAAAYANILGASLGMVWKKRTSATTVESITIVGDVAGKDVLIVDDITETAGTLTNAAKLMRESGAKSVRAAVSHSLLSPVAYERLAKGHIDELITTNTIPIDSRPACPSGSSAWLACARRGHCAHPQQRERHRPVSGIKVLSLVTIVGGTFRRDILSFFCSMKSKTLYRIAIGSFDTWAPGDCSHRGQGCGIGLQACPAHRLHAGFRGQVPRRHQLCRCHRPGKESGGFGLLDQNGSRTRPGESIFSPVFRRRGSSGAWKVSEEGLGSGVIVSSDGYILTNNHVVEGADELNVVLPDDREFKAKVIGADPKTDIAVIKIDADHLPTGILADSDKLRVGDVVLCHRQSAQKLAVTVTMGASSRPLAEKILACSITAMSAATRTSSRPTPLSIWATPVARSLTPKAGSSASTALFSPLRGATLASVLPFRSIWPQALCRAFLIGTGKVTRGYLGVNTDALTAEIAEQLGVSKDTQGVVITDVKPDSPAAKAGLKRSDVILALNGKVVESLEDLRLLISETPPGTEVAIKLVRDGQEKTVNVILGTLSDEIADNELLPGVTVTKLTDEKRRELNIDDRVTGLLITNVDDNSPYSDKLAVGAVIIEINRTPVATVPSAKELLVSGPQSLTRLLPRCLWFPAHRHEVTCFFKKQAFVVERGVPPRSNLYLSHSLDRFRFR